MSASVNTTRELTFVDSSQRPRTTHTDIAAVWNTATLDAIRADSTGPPLAARNLAMVHLAIHDAMAIAIGHSPLYLQVERAPRGTAPRIAASQAAYHVLSGLYPDQEPLFAKTLAATLSRFPAGRARSRGIEFGDSVGRLMLAIRADDGSSLMVEGPGATDPGAWIPTPPRFLPPLAPQWPQVTPFVLRSGDQFRPPPPPALDSPEYAAALNEVKAIGGTVSAVRTAEQAAIGHFWADVPGATFTPPGHWNQIAANAARSRRLGPLQTARMFATLNTALADAAICCWDAKYHYDFWRPVTAIRSADTDGNPETTSDPDWTPLWVTPNFPAYTSGHSTFSGAAQVVLESFFGKTFRFRDPGDPTQNLTPRFFRSFEQAAEEAGVSRIYGGIHFRFDNTIGMEGGRIVGNEILSRFGITGRTGRRS